MISNKGILQGKAWIKSDVKPMRLPSIDDRVRHLETFLCRFFDVAVAQLVPGPKAYGLACAQNGHAACRQFFPDTLWVSSLGLASDMSKQLAAYRSTTGREPRQLVVQNLGVYVLGNTHRQINRRSIRFLKKLREIYVKAGVLRELSCASVPGSPAMEKQIKFHFSGDAEFLASTGIFIYALGGITPQHLMHSGPAPFSAALSFDNIQKYRDLYGSRPKVVVAGDRVYGLGLTETGSRLALESALETALVVMLSEAFGGVVYLPNIASPVFSEAV